MLERVANELRMKEGGQNGLLLRFCAAVVKTVMVQPIGINRRHINARQNGLGRIETSFRTEQPGRRILKHLGSVAVLVGDVVDRPHDSVRSDVTLENKMRFEFLLGNFYQIIVTCRNL